MKFVWFILLIFFVNYSQASEVKQTQQKPQLIERRFRPSKRNCGGAMQHRTFAKEIACMKAGFKDVALVYERQLEENKKNYDFKALRINIIQLNDQEKQVILYTPRGEKNALLLAKYYQIRSSSEQKNPQEITYLAPNHYIVGHLLGYSNKDIKSFYRGTFTKDNYSYEKKYDEDKQIAKNWLKNPEAWEQKKEEIEAKFVPSEQSCGAAVTKKNIPRSITDDEEFACMLAGFKQVMWTEPNFLKKLKEKDPDILSKNNIKYFEVEKFDEIVLYRANNPHATHNAYLFKLYRTEFLNNRAKYVSLTPISKWRTYFNRFVRLFKKAINWGEILHENAYLQGYLLGYSNDDIKYYYDQPNPWKGKFEEHKKKAEEWLVKHDPWYLVK